MNANEEEEEADTKRSSIGEVITNGSLSKTRLENERIAFEQRVAAAEERRKAREAEQAELRNFTKRKDSNYDDFSAYIDKTMSHCINSSLKLYNKKEIVVFVDLKKTYIKNMDVSLFKNMIPYFEEKYPYCVEKIIITNIPGFFKICYNLIKMFIHKDTKKKIFFEKKIKKGDSTSVSFSNELEELEL